jgi:hypothetical protein
VQVAASMAQAASTALPPRLKVIAPAVAASGLPVIATQWRPWSTGFAVRWAAACVAIVRRRANQAQARSVPFLIDCTSMT